MKKLFKILFTLILSLLCIAMFVTYTTKPETNLNRADKNLKYAEYTVTHEDDEDLLPIYLEERLYASKTYNSFNESKTYSVTIMKFKDFSTAGTYFLRKLCDRYYYKKELKAEIKFYQNLHAYYSDEMSEGERKSIEEQLKNLDKKLNEMNDQVCGISGKTVWYGHRSAVEASK